MMVSMCPPVNRFLGEYPAGHTHQVSGEAAAQVERERMLACSKHVAKLKADGVSRAFLAKVPHQTRSRED